MIDGTEIRGFGTLCLHSLVQSALHPGHHYIFVCGCGEAGCGGYGPVEVSFEGPRIFWQIDETLNGAEQYYVFTRIEFVKELIVGLDQILSNLHPNREDCFYSLSLRSKARIRDAIQDLKLNLESQVV